MGRPLGFTDEKKRSFLDALVRTECVKQAAREAGVMPGTVAYARGADQAFGGELDGEMPALPLHHYVTGHSTALQFTPAFWKSMAPEDHR